MGKPDRYLFVSDLQLPYAQPNALKFCKAVQREFQIPSENVYCVGDEVDLYWGSLHKKDPEASYTPNQELETARRQLREWYRHFPEMKLAISNHGLRYLRKANDAEIPSQVLKTYEEILQAPKGWRWKEQWIIKGTRARMNMIHGMGYSGANGHKNAAIDYSMNTIIGHLHSHAGINYLHTAGRKIWAMNTGSLIDPKQFAFAYSRYNRNAAVLSVGVVLDGGLTPILLPFERM